MSINRPKAYSYLRFSTPDQMKGDSFRRQKEAAEKYAETHGLDLDTRLSFEDLGISAFKGGNRDAKLGAFIQALESGDIKPDCYLLVESLDRLSRDYVLNALTQLNDIVNLGVTVVTLSDEKQYNSVSLQKDTMTLMYSLMIMGRANEESAMKSQRLGAAWERKRIAAREQGELLTTKVPAWLTTSGGEFAVVEDRAETVRRIFTLTLEGLGKGRIARQFNEESVLTFGKSRGWHASYVQKILDSEAVIGVFQPHKMERNDQSGKMRRVPDGAPIEDYFPAVVERAIFLKARDNRTSRRISGGQTGKRFANIFSGLATCGNCGGSLHYINKGSARTYLHCSNSRRKLGNCDSTPVNYKDAEDAVLDAGVGYVDFKEVYPKTEASLTASLHALEDDKRTLEDDEKKTAASLKGIGEALISRPDSPTLLSQLDTLEAQQMDNREKLSLTSARVDAERGRLAALASDIESVQEALATWKNEQDVCDDATAYKLRSRLNQVLKRVIEEIRFDGLGATIVFLKPQISRQTGSFEELRISQISWRD